MILSREYFMLAYDNIIYALILLLICFDLIAMCLQIMRSNWQKRDEHVVLKGAAWSCEKGKEEGCLLCMPMSEWVRRANILQRRAIQRKVEREARYGTMLQHLGNAYHTLLSLVLFRYQSKNYKRVQIL
jgi:hypothetical protein